MERFPFVLTIFIMLLGPVHLIPAFAGLTRGSEVSFKRAVAWRGAAIAAAVTVFAALAARPLVEKYHLSIESLGLAGGLLLLVSALQTIGSSKPEVELAGKGATPLRIALSPLATPTIVPPAGIAAILIFVMLEATYPGITQAVLIALAIVMPLNFLAMALNDKLLKIPGLVPMLQLLGAVLVFVQVALAFELIVSALRRLVAFHG